MKEPRADIERRAFLVEGRLMQGIEVGVQLLCLKNSTTDYIFQRLPPPSLTSHVLFVCFCFVLFFCNAILPHSHEQGEFISPCPEILPGSVIADTTGI